MAQVLQTRTSLKDIDTIWDYIAEKSPALAARFVHRLKQKLAENPFTGHVRPRR